MSDDPIGDDNISNSELASLLHRTAKMMARSYHSHAHAHHAQAHVMSIIKERGPLSQKKLLRILDVRSSSLSELLSKLEQRGLIVRKRDENDKRSLIVSAKRGAGSPCADSRKEVGNCIYDVFDVLDDDEKQQLSILLQKIMTNF